MKFLIKTAVDLAHTKEVAKEVTQLYKDLGLEVKFDVEDITFDSKNEIFYQKDLTWSFLAPTWQKTIKWEVVAILHKPGYDGTCLMVDANKGLQDRSTRGQYSRNNDIGLIEVYSDLVYIKKEKRKDGQWYYSNHKRKTNLKHDTFVLFHEVAHHLEQCVGMDGLHKAELKDVQGIYLETVITLLKKNSKIDKLFPRIERDIKVFLEKAKKAGIPCRVTEGFRSIERQNELYAQGRTKPGKIVTNAKGGESWHCFGLAFDIVPLKGYNIPVSDWEKLGKIGESLGLEWGGRWVKFKDMPHFQIKTSYTLKDLQQNNVDWSIFQ